MKILLVNQDWFAEEFREAGHEVLTYGFAQHLEVRPTQALIDMQTLVEGLPNGFRPDRILVHDNSAPIVFPGFERIEIPCAFYSVDAHHHYLLHRYLTHLFDHTFVAQKDYMAELEALGRRTEWLPLWASRLADPSIEKKHGAVFVGTMDADLNPDRVKFFSELKASADVFCTMGEWWNIFPYSEIVINQTVKGDLNFRVFEAMGSGSLLLTERSPNGLFEIFEDGKHLIAYDKGNVEQASELIHYYLDNPQRTREIAAAGREEIVQKHLARHRAARVLGVLENLTRTKSNMRKMAAFRNFAHLATLLEKRKDRGTAARAAVQALKSFEEALNEHEEMTGEAAIYLALTATYFDNAFASKDGLGLLTLAGEAYPSFPVIQLARIRLLVQSGQRALAEELAKKLNGATLEKVLPAADEIIGGLLAQL